LLFSAAKVAIDSEVLFHCTIFQR